MKLPLGDLNPDPCSSHPTSIYTLCTLLSMSLQIQKEMIIKDLINYFIRKIKAMQRTNYNFKRDSAAKKKNFT